MTLSRSLPPPRPIDATLCVAPVALHAARLRNHSPASDNRRRCCHRSHSSGGSSNSSNVCKSAQRAGTPTCLRVKNTLQHPFYLQQLLQKCTPPTPSSPFPSPSPSHRHILLFLGFGGGSSSLFCSPLLGLLGLIGLYWRRK